MTVLAGWTKIAKTILGKLPRGTIKSLQKMNNKVDKGYRFKGFEDIILHNIDYFFQIYDNNKWTILAYHNISTTELKMIHADRKPCKSGNSHPHSSVSVTSSRVAIGWSPTMEAGPKLNRLMEVIMELM